MKRSKTEKAADVMLAVAIGLLLAIVIASSF